MSDLPIYPHFKAVLLADKPVFDAALAKDLAQTSDLSFISFYAWGALEKTEFSLLDDLIIIKRAALEPPEFYEPVGQGDKKAAITRVLKDNGGAFVRVSKGSAEYFQDDNNFVVEAQREYFDYLYNIADLVALPGAKYHSKRNLIHRFKESQAYEYFTFDADNISECLGLEEAWCRVKDCDNVESLSSERQVLKVMVDHFAQLELIGAGIKIDEKLCAIVIAGRLNADTLVGHILKADANITGLYQTMLNEFLSREGKSFRYINLEDDLGVEGLRKSKLSYHPVRLVEKYRITIS